MSTRASITENVDYADHIKDILARRFSFRRLITRQIFSLGAAAQLMTVLVGIITMLNQFDVTLAQPIRWLIGIIAAGSEFFWGIVLGYINIGIPDFAAQYLTMGFIVAGMSLRKIHYDYIFLDEGVWGSISASPFLIAVVFPNKVTKSLELKAWSNAPKWRFGIISALQVINGIFIWPIIISMSIYRFIFPHRFIANVNDGFVPDRLHVIAARKTDTIFFETFVWILIIFLINYLITIGAFSGWFGL